MGIFGSPFFSCINNNMANILSCPVPSNVNPLSSNGFRFNIAKLPELQYFCQEVNIPGITLGEPAMFNPFAQVPIPGETLTYDTLNVKFMIDADMSNYIAIYNWIVALGFPQSYEQYIAFVSKDQRGILGELAKNYSGATLQILNNTNNPVKTVNFTDMFPVSLGTLNFQSTSQDVNYLIGDATFRFSYYTFTI
jgi:hypothetical protein